MANVLICEDEILVARMYEQAFKRSGHTVSTVIGGEECLKALKREVPDIVLLDIMMPEMSGMDTLSSIKKDDRYADLPVIMLTNMSGDVDKEEARRLGADDYWVKSQMKPSEVVSRVEKIVEGD